MAGYCTAKRSHGTRSHRLFASLPESAMSRRLCLLLTVLTLPTAAGAGEPDRPALARQAHSILKANCYRCHGQDGANEGGVNYILDVARLIERRKVVPGDVAKSRLFKRVTHPDDPMPPEDEKARPSKDDITLLRRWIEAGAPSFDAPSAARTPITPAALLKLIRADLDSVGARDRRF